MYDSWLVECANLMHEILENSRTVVLLFAGFKVTV